MTEAEWLTSDDPEEMYFRVVQPREHSRRRMDLLCTACARLVRHLMDDAGARAAFEWLEANPGRRELPRGSGHVRELFRGPARALYDAHHRREGGVSGGATHVAYDLWADWYEYAFPNLRDYFAGRPGVLPADPGVYLPAVMRDLFRYRPIALDPGWRTADVLGLCRGMHESRDFGAMPMLADALMDAGCADEQLLAHCRGDGPHVRGCWVVDLVLGLG